MTSPISGGRKIERTSRRKAIRTRWIVWTLVALTAVIVGAGAWVGVRGWLAKGELEAAVPLAAETRAAILGGDSEAAVRLAKQLRMHGAAATSYTSDPVWRAAELIPSVGANFSSLRAIAAAFEVITANGVVPLAQAADELGLASFQPHDGRVDLAPIVALQQPVHEASAAIASASTLLDDAGVRRATLINPLGNARDEFVRLLDETQDVVSTLDRAARLVPSLLGSGGPRDILLLFQNNAELRSTGGIPGALALLHTDSGSFTLAQQADSGDFPRYDPPVMDLPLETRALWGDNTARFIQDVTFAPQFSIGASTAREMWAREFGTVPTAVVAIDPVALSYLLRATGPLTLPTGDELTAENAVQLLLRDVYQRYPDSSDQDAFFASAAATVLDAVSEGSVEPRALIEAFGQAGSERRILIWSSDPAEQSILSETTLSGGLPVSDRTTQAFGVYLNDMTASKMDAFLDVQISAGQMTCRNDERPEYRVMVTLKNTAPADAGVVLPEYVTGGGKGGVPPGEIKTSIHVYSAPNTFNLGVSQGGVLAEYHPTSDSGYTLSKVVSQLKPGETASWEFSFLGDQVGEREIVIESTPTIYVNEVSGLAPTCDSSVS